MNAYFADTSYYVALLNPDDEANDLARRLTASLDDTIVTTAWILVELGTYLCDPPNRALFVTLLNGMKANPRVTIVPPTQLLLDAGIDLYSNRLDKSWSVTDCISFVVMKEFKLTRALATDHHFEQAGFEVILR